MHPNVCNVETVKMRRSRPGWGFCATHKKLWLDRGTPEILGDFFVSIGPAINLNTHAHGIEVTDSLKNGSSYKKLLQCCCIHKPYTGWRKGDLTLLLPLVSSNLWATLYNNTHKIIILTPMKIHSFIHSFISIQP